MSISNENNPCVTVVELGAITADAEVPAAYFSKSRVITKVSVIDAAGIVASDVNYAVLSLKNGSDVVASYDTRAAGQGALTANVAGEAAIVAAQAAVAAGSTLTLDYNEEGTVAMTAAKLVIESYAK